MIMYTGLTLWCCW